MQAIFGFAVIILNVEPGAYTPLIALLNILSKLLTFKSIIDKIKQIKKVLKKKKYILLLKRELVIGES